MVKLQKWEKQEVLGIYKQNRKNKRCEIVKKLINKRDVLTKDINKELKELTETKKALIETKEKLLKEHKLFTFDVSVYGCPVDKLCEVLIQFDKETENNIQNIIYDKKIMED